MFSFSRGTFYFLGVNGFLISEEDDIFQIEQEYFSTHYDIKERHKIELLRDDLQKKKE